MHSPSASDTGSKPVASPEPPPGARAEKRTLLIVDDEEGPRQSLRVVFKDEYNLLLANDGATAVNLAKQNKVDVCITDIRMVGMSGVELLAHLKAIDPAIEVLVLTAYETAETLRQALRLGACDYLNKPFDITAIRASVANAMQRRSLAEEIRNNSQQLQELQSELENQRMAEQITRTRGEIYASIIHDVNGPLTVISGFIQLMNQRIGSATRVEGEDLEFVRDRLKTITRQVTNCIEISRRYLSFLRERKDEPPRVGVNVLLEDLKELVDVHPSKQGHEMVIHPLDEDVAVKINGTDLIQILLNLAVNAFQASSTAHRVEIRGSLVSRPLDLSTVTDDGQNLVVNREGFFNQAPLLSLSVSDTGPGIAPDALPRIFDPYFTTKTGSQGTGLGLNIVQRLVGEARGVLQVQTEPGRGTTFTVYLPAVLLHGDLSF